MGPSKGNGKQRHQFFNTLFIRDYEVHLDVYEAITREKQIKKWNRQWKINLIEQNNPQWLNLANGLF